MPILKQQDQDAILQKFKVELKRDVNITLYTKNDIGGLFIPGRECRTCESAQQLLGEVSALSPKIKLDVVDFYGNQEEAKNLGIDKIPAIVVSPSYTGKSSGDNVRLYGLPTGIEFAVLLDTIIASSTKGSSLQLETRRRLKRLKEDVHIQVFVTPT